MAPSPRIANRIAALQVGDLVTFDKQMWRVSFDPYLCKTINLSMDATWTNPDDFKSEVLSIDSMMIIVYVHPVAIGAKYALLTPSGRIGWAWDVWVKKC